MTPAGGDDDPMAGPTFGGDPQETTEGTEASGPAAGAPMLARMAAAVLHTSPLVVLVLDADLRVVGCNPTATELLGTCDASMVTGRPIRHLLAPDREAAVVLGDIRHAIADVAAQQERHPTERWQDAGILEVDLRVGDGPTRTVRFSWAPCDVPELPGGAVAVGRDVTAQHRLARDLAVVADSFRALAEASGLGLYRLRLAPQPRFEEVNGAFADTVGIEPRRLAQERAEDHLSADALGALRASRRDPGRAMWPVHGTWLHPDGRILDLEFTEVPEYDDHGQVVAVMGLVRDLTAQREHEAAMAQTLRLERDAAQRLRHVDDLRRVFLRAVSHELRTPLTSVLGFTATLKAHADRLPPERTVEIIGRAHAQALRVQALLDDLLDVDRLARGVVGLDRSEVDLVALVEGSIEVAEMPARVDAPTAADATHAGSAGGVPGVGGVAAEVDADKLHRVMVSLLGNARRHAGVDAEVVVTVRRDGDEVELIVDDDGPGVPGDLRDAVFEAFQQGPEAAASHAPGTGIGLTLVAEFVRLHGGTVHIDDSDLGGARVVVRLPARAPGAAGDVGAAADVGTKGAAGAAGARSGD